MKKKNEEIIPDIKEAVKWFETTGKVFTTKSFANGRIKTLIDHIKKLELTN